MNLTEPYRGHKPPLRESIESLQARIPGWGSDLDPADRPAVPREDLRWRPEGATWDLPEQQPHEGYRERSIEHADLTPCFGTAQPLHGLSGVLRKMAYDRWSEARAAHWLVLVAADRVDTYESALTALLRGRPDNLVAETGVHAELTHGGLRSRLGRGRTDVAHHWMDPLVVAGPWLGLAGAAYVVGRRALRR